MVLKQIQSDVHLYGSVVRSCGHGSGTYGLKEDRERSLLTVSVVLSSQQRICYIKQTNSVA
jgi:hypothetical protein